MKAGVAKQQQRLHAHTDTHSHPQKKSERNNIKSKEKKWLKKQQIQPDVRQHTETTKHPKKKKKRQEKIL